MRKILEGVNWQIFRTFKAKLKFKKKQFFFANKRILLITVGNIRRITDRK